jgi:hypothetical protein
MEAIEELDERHSSQGASVAMKLRSRLGNSFVGRSC